MQSSSIKIEQVESSVAENTKEELAKKAGAKT